MEADMVVEERKKRTIDFFKRNYSIVTYALLAIVVFIAVRIRTRNLPGLRDITTGGWTLGPDLDPFLFLRWAKYIVAHGTLMAVDTMRYVPFGLNTKEELLGVPYFTAWFHKLAVWFGSGSVEQSAVLFPVFMFALTVISFFFFVREIFINFNGKKQASIIALVAAVFLSISPSLLPRTIAGIPEKESAAFFFMFLAFYLFIVAWREQKMWKQITLSLLAGIATVGMAAMWGAWGYVQVTIGLAVLIAFIFNPTQKEKLVIYTIWLFSSIFLMIPISTRYYLGNIIHSTQFLIIFGIGGFMAVHFLIFNTSLKKYVKTNFLDRLPPVFVSALILGAIGLLFLWVFFGTDFLKHAGGDVIKSLVHPVITRLGVTVAENKQPYYDEWGASFGPIVAGIPILFWLFFIGAIYLFYRVTNSLLKIKERIILTTGYLIFIAAVIFSRYAPNSIFNGENAISLLAYFGGFVALLGTIGYYYYKHYKEGTLDVFKSVDFGPMVLFSLFFFTLVSARLAIRLIMVLVPASSILAAYLITASFARIQSIKEKTTNRTVAIAIAIIIVASALFATYSLYKITTDAARGYVPSQYTQQWQKAMAWVRENTVQNAVFGHWWDYGYWVQSIGDRATVLDGGNAISYWNHLMGRYALTGNSSREAAEFLYAHNTTHFLIDSSDIGKYTAFSSIGSNKEYDRRSWITTFLLDTSQTRELKNATGYVYQGGFSLDEDIIYDFNGTRVFLPGLDGSKGDNNRALAGLGAVVLTIANDGKLLQPIGVFVYQGKQYQLLLRYAYFDDKFYDFGSGVEGGIFSMPRIDQSGSQLGMVKNGALLYLSRRTVHSQLARLYLYGMEDEFFEEAHVEDDFIVANLKEQGIGLKRFVYYQGVRGPITIWKIRYPSDIAYKPEYLNTTYPEDILLS